MNRSTPGLPVQHQLPEFTQTHIHRVSDAIQPSHPLSSPSPPAPNPSQHQSFPMSQLFTWGGQSTGVSALVSFLPKKSQGWSPSEWTGWISLQSNSSKASILQRSAFFIVQLSHPHMNTGKTIALTRWTFVGRVMSLLLNMLSRLVIAFLPRSKRLLISWLQSPSAVTFSSVQSLSHVWLFAIPRITALQATLSITNSRSSLRLTSIESVIPSSHLILCRPLLLLPPIPPSISLFRWVNSSHEVAKVLEFQLQHQSFQWTPRTDLL